VKEGWPTSSSPVRETLAVESVDVLVVGAGQSGLGTAHWLRELAPELSCLLVDGSSRVGASWEDRWESLRLFTPRRYSALPGLAFPHGKRNPTKLEMADYLRDYAAPFDVRLDWPVHRLVRTDAGFVVNGEIRARHVVIAAGPYPRAYLPDAADKLNETVHQLHSSEYSNPIALPAGDVLVVGGGNSAAQIALELSRTRRVTVVAGGATWYLPESVLGVSTYSWLSLFGVLDAPTDGRAGRLVRRNREGVFGTELRTAVRRGQLGLLPRRVTGACGSDVLLDDGTALPVSVVLWCTGFQPDYPWLDVQGALDDTGAPLHDDGTSPVPGLHWMGLPWLRGLDSAIVHGVSADARQTVIKIVAASRP
jgi:putative flavoprotein involved in K+ transport